MPPLGQRHFEYGAAVRLTLDVDRAPEAPHQRTHVSKADAVARPVLNARPAEQIEDTLTIRGIDAATVVANLVGDRSIGFGASDLDAPVVCPVESGPSPELGPAHRELVEHDAA